MHHRVLFAILLVLAPWLPAVAAPGVDDPPLSFEARVEAEWAIEEVYWRHRIWPESNPAPKPPLASVMSEAAVRAKVSDYLRKSSALERFWGRGVTRQPLQAELARMSRDTRDPKMLRELHAALDDDPRLIAETLGRRTLVDRLLRNWYAQEDRFHGDVERSAREALARTRDVGELAETGAEVTESTYVLDDAPSPDRAEEGVSELDAGDWKRWGETLALAFGTTAEEIPLREPSALEETADGFQSVVLLSRTEARMTVATATWPKVSFDAWWEHEGLTLSVSPAIDPGPVTLLQPSGSGCAADEWQSRFYSPGARSVHTAVWTGTEMIVWGGYGSVLPRLDTGFRYDPATDTWTPTSRVGAPSGRMGHTAVWTGTEMIVWGGGEYGGYPSTGGRYDPTTDEWTEMEASGAPGYRTSHTAVWTGTEMIVWGGSAAFGPSNTGGRYDPSDDTWVPTSTAAGVPSNRAAHTAVWTGTTMVVWGGRNPSGVYLATGGRYDPSTDSWLPTPSGTNAPSARGSHTAVWTGAQMIVWGGTNGSVQSTGGRYDPAADTWLVPPTGVGKPAARQSHTAAWTGTEMIVWGGLGGSGGSSGLNTGGRYDPSNDAWVPTTTGSNVASPRHSHTMVWTGTEMIVWGGQSGVGNTPLLDTGSRYRPSSDSWLATSAGANVPLGRWFHSAVWTGAEMIVWGGFNGALLDAGGRYDPATDVWVPTSRGANVPAARYMHTAVWTGTEMIVWGGFQTVGDSNAGGRYDPASDAWQPTSITASTPTARREHTAVWTGTEMIVWGGTQNGVNTGGRYDPVTGGWTATLVGTSTPERRTRHTAVWTGTEMVVWGGFIDESVFGNYLPTGGGYNPATNTWTSTVGNGMPAAREEHTAVWTGSEMIVWGGHGATYFNSGARYVPVPITWSPTSTGGGTPGPRRFHSAVWTGTEMIVWGGSQDEDPYYASGSRYNPSTNAWLSTSTSVAGPSARYRHTAVWTGTQMIVWGGLPASRDLSFYCLACPDVTTSHRDADADGYGDPAVFIDTADCSIPSNYVGNDLDCDDGDPLVHPGVEEICDGLDKDCNLAVDDGFAVPPGSPVLHVNETAETWLAWSSLAAATSYDVVRGSLAILRSSTGDFTSSTNACVANNVAATSVPDDAMPGPGNGEWYLVRPVNCTTPGTYDTGAGSQVAERDEEIDAAASSCP